MGALHAGHRSLVVRAREECDAVCASIFVNPLQFDDPRDYERYPRDLERDAELLADAGCEMAFTGTLAQFFPGDVRADGGFDPGALVDPGPAAEGLEGKFRPGHFAGVATIVSRLFDLVVPGRAYFGQKDFQQTLVVRDLARRRGGPRIVVCETKRESSGLAMSSRNVLLEPDDRREALAIPRALLAARAAWRNGERRRAPLVRAMEEELDRSKLRLEYAEVCDPERWNAPDTGEPLERAIALIAVRAGRVRLIDNMFLHDAEGELACPGA
jgi:pantoate--beta-alanine ligase